MPAFFRELRRTARSTGRRPPPRAAAGHARPSATPGSPCCITRLASGRIWYVPGFAGTPGGTDVGWEALLAQIKENLEGPRKVHADPRLRTARALVGPTRELARRWADEEVRDGPAPARRPAAGRPVPLGDRRGGSLPAEGARGASSRLELTRRFGDLRRTRRSTTGSEAARRHGLGRTSPHRVLAGLPFPLYITTNPDDQLADALVAQAGKDPRVELCRWHDAARYDWPGRRSSDRGRARLPADAGRAAGLPPLRPARDLPDSLVLTEDDYFDFLIGVDRGTTSSIPPVVKAALVDVGPAVPGLPARRLGLPRPLPQHPGRRASATAERGYPHVAAQIDPEEGRNLDPERARRLSPEVLRTGRTSDLLGEHRRLRPRALRQPERRTVAVRPRGRPHAAAPDRPPSGAEPVRRPAFLPTGEPLFGRDREARELFDLLVAERIVLLHSPSGAGKTLAASRPGLIPLLAAGLRSPGR